MLVDLVLVAIIAFFAFKYYKVGLFCSILGMGTFLISIAVAYFLKSIIAFALTYVGLTVVLLILRHIKLPLVTRVDKYLGLALGLVFGLLVSSLLATVLYSLAEISSNAGFNDGLIDVYNGSYVFKFVYNLRIFDFIKKLIQ